MSIHRHWQWADWTKEEFEYHLKIDAPEIFKDRERNIEFILFNGSTGKNMFLWYALLYAACEGIKELYREDYFGNKVDIYQIAPDFKELESDLRLFRNGAFHVQSDYYTKKFHNFLKVAEYASKVRKIHKNIGDYIMEQVIIFDKAIIAENREST